MIEASISINTGANIDSRFRTVVQNLSGRVVGGILHRATLLSNVTRVRTLEDVAYLPLTAIAVEDLNMAKRLLPLAMPYLVAAADRMLEGVVEAGGNMIDWIQHHGGHGPQGGNGLHGIALQVEPTPKPIGETYPGYCQAEPGQLVQQSYPSNIDSMATYYGVTRDQIIAANPGIVINAEGMIDQCTCVNIPSAHLDLSNTHIYPEMPACTAPDVIATPASVQTTNGIVTVTPQPTVVPTPEILPTPTASIDQQIIERLNSPMCGLEPTQYNGIVPTEMRLLEPVLQQAYMGASLQEQSIYSEVFAEHFACNTQTPTVFDSQQVPIGIDHVQQVLACITQANDPDTITAHNLRSEAAKITWVREQCAAIELHDVNGNLIATENGGVKSIFDLMNDAARQAYDTVQSYRVERNVQATTSGDTFQQELSDKVEEVGLHPAIKILAATVASLGAVPTVGNAIYHTIDKLSERSRKFGFVGVPLLNSIDWTANGIRFLWEAMKPSKEIKPNDENQE